MSINLPIKLTPPNFLNATGKKEFGLMDYKMQCFIYYKYVSFYDRKTIQYKMFIKSEKTYMKLNRQAKAFVNDFGYGPNRGGVKIPGSDK